MGPSNAPLSAFTADKSPVEILGFRIDVVKVCTLKAPRFDDCLMNIIPRRQLHRRRKDLGAPREVPAGCINRAFGVLPFTIASAYTDSISAASNAARRGSSEIRMDS